MTRLVRPYAAELEAGLKPADLWRAESNPPFRNTSVFESLAHGCEQIRLVEIEELIPAAPRPSRSGVAGAGSA